MSDLNMEAWDRSAQSFIKSKGLEREFRDFCGGWPTPIDPVNLRAAHKSSWMLEYEREAKKNLGWKDISTAPKEGERILINSDWGGVTVAWWEDGQGGWPSGFYCIGTFLHIPTHWQPLPSPPPQTTNNEQGE